MKTPIIQFGTSRFLQAHADLFISQAREDGQDVGPITIVQSSGDRSRSNRLAAFAKPFPVRVEGLVDGKPVSETVSVSSVKNALSTAQDWDEVRRIFCEEAEIVLSNTADAGYAPQPCDQDKKFHQDMSYPAKLTCLLYERFTQGAKPIQIMPMELIVNNGDVLKQRVLELASSREAGFRDYLQAKVIWVNSLVDRIVSEPLEPAGAVAEPYALWAIEDQAGLVVPCQHPAVQVVPSLEMIEALKLFVLNLSHTFFADRWLQTGGPSTTLVRDFMENDAELSALKNVMQNEVQPAFVAAGVEQAFKDYVEVTFQRFANPFLDHRVADIAQNHRQKVERRLGAFLEFAKCNGDPSAKPALSEIVEQNKAVT